MDPVILETKPVSKYPAWKVISALLAFPPIAFAMIWKDRTYHGWFAWLSWVFGGFLILYFMYLSYVVVPQINGTLARTTYGEVSVYFGMWDWILVFGFSLIQFVFGFVLRIIYKKGSALSTAWLITAVVFLSLDYVVPVLVYMRILAPIYDSILG